MKYCIGSGWWCANEAKEAVEIVESNAKDNSSEASLSRGLYGDDSIRGVDFHITWYESIKRACSPTAIVIVDSASPIVPTSIQSTSDITYIRLNENAGHSVNHSGHLSGWTRSVVISALYAAFSDVDYYVYVEQDALLQGKGIIEHAIKNMKSESGLMFGSPHSKAQPLQQSFFVIKKDVIDRFVGRLLSIRYTDQEISPEFKFALCSSRFYHFIPKFLFVSSSRKTLFGRGMNRLRMHASGLLANFDVLPFGYGRDRPLDFSDEYLYFQHGEAVEIKRYIKKAKQL